MAEIETRPNELARRKKAISLFKSMHNDDYLLYFDVLKENAMLPPDITLQCSRNFWDTTLRNWKITVHNWIRENKLDGIKDFIQILTFLNYPNFPSNKNTTHDFLPFRF